MNTKWMKYSKMFLKRNSATILTCVGAVGVVATGVMTAKATPKALRLVDQAREEKEGDLTTFEVVKAAAPAYISVVVTGAATIACVFGANVLNKRQQASIASAYALLDKSYREYKKKVDELYGEDAGNQVREEIAKDQYKEEEITVDDGNRLFYDEFSGRYFESTLEKVQNAEYFINRDLSLRDWATVNEFYDYLGIDHIDGGDEIGWSSGMNFDYYWQQWIDFSHHKVVMDDGLECIILTMFGEPSMGWEDYS